MSFTEEKYNHQYHLNVHNVTKEQFEIISLYRAKKLQKFIDANDKVLEYGVGNTWNLINITCLEKTGYDIFIDKSFYQSGINLLTDKNQIPTNYFDKIICHHVLEHVENPIEILSEIKTYLNKNGSLVCYVPYREKDKWGKTFNSKDKNQHLYSWNIQTFCMLLVRAGFIIKSSKVKQTGFDRWVAVLITRYKLPRYLYPFIKKIMQAIRQDYEIEIVAT